ncbi:MAG TPA: tripartite tricarboxylate transporter permease [Thermodesulfobacteriota bacterium]|nr:tripartite tricarboxylate transporter permease [Thermodesulfobacteriota bacterium]
MDFVSHILLAFQVALEPMNIFLCFLGCLMGTFVGVLPGLGPAASISLLLPITFKLPAESAIIMLGGLYYGTMYGGSTTSILLNVPGEAASVVTCLDGYRMAQKGRAGPALGIAAFGSFIAGTFGTIMIMIMAPPLAGFALKFGPPEFVGLVFLGLTMVTYLSSGSMAKALMMAIVGLLISYIGTDIVTGKERFTLGIATIAGGFDMVPIAMGLFGISEVLLNLERRQEGRDTFRTTLRDLLPSARDWKVSSGPIARGTIMGFFLGIIPGGGGMIPSFISYAMEKKMAKDPATFGTGDIRGVAGPESANNAGAQGTFIPMLTMGIPCNVVLAILMGALMIHGVTPGPRLLEEHPRIFWGVVGSMYVGNAMLLLLNLPLIGLWVRLLKVPYSILFPFIFLFCLIGAYTVGNNVQDVFIMILFGVLGYLMKKYEYEPAPLVLAFVLGPMFENALRQSLILSGGNPSIFLYRPIAAIFLAISFILLASPLFLRLLGRQRPGLMVKD